MKRQLTESDKMTSNMKRRNNNPQHYEDMVRHLPDIQIKKVVGKQESSTENIMKTNQFVLYLQDTPSSNTLNQNQNLKLNEDKVLHILKEEGVEQSNDFIIHRLTLSQIMRKINLIIKSSHKNNNIDQPCQLWIYCYPSNISCTKIQQFFSTFRSSITRLTLIQSDIDNDNNYNNNNNNNNDNVTVQDLLKILLILHEKLEYLEFSGYMFITMPTKVLLPVPIFPNKFIKLKTLLCGKQKPGAALFHLRQQQQEDEGMDKNPNLQNENGFFIRELLIASPNLTRIENYPLLLLAGRDPNSSIELDINLLIETNLMEAVKSLSIDEKLKTFVEKATMESNRIACNNMCQALVKLNHQTIESLEIRPLDSVHLSPIKFLQLKKLNRLTFSDDEMRQTRFFEQGGKMDPYKLFPNLKTVKLDLNLPFDQVEASNLLGNCYFPLNSFFYFPANGDSTAKYRTFETVKTLELCKYMPESCLQQVRFLFPNILKLNLKLEKLNWNLNQIIHVVPLLWSSLEHLTLLVEFEDLRFIPESFVTKFLPAMKKLKVVEFCIGLPQENNTCTNLVVQPLWISTLVELLHSKSFPGFRVNLFCEWNRSNKNIQDVQKLFAKLMDESHVTFNF